MTVTTLLRGVEMRRPESEIARLLALAWWDWPIERISRHVRAIAGFDLAALEAAAAADG